MNIDDLHAMIRDTEAGRVPWYVLSEDDRGSSVSFDDPESPKRCIMVEKEEGFVKILECDATGYPVSNANLVTKYQAVVKRLLEVASKQAVLFN
jgi:hypothetical protein